MTKHNGRTVRLDLARGRRWPARARLLGAALLLAAALCCLAPLAAAGAMALPRRLTAWLAPSFSARLQALEAENFTLRSQLAAHAGLAQENAALRALVGSERTRGSVWQPARTVARGWGGHTLLYCNADAAPASGAAVLDRYGRCVGTVAAVRGRWIEAVPLGPVACLAGGTSGVLDPGSAPWRLTGLPAAAMLRAGTPVTTVDGLWLGRLAQAPQADSNGLTASAPLTDTARRSDTVYFVATG